jgi:hypothetical protein
MELGSVTLKRIGFFCFPIKHSTHTESNKPYLVNGVTGLILKSTTEVTWAGRESKSPSQKAPVGNTVKRGGRGGKVIQNKRRAKNDVEPRVHWTLNTVHQFIIIDHLYQDT